MAPLRPDDDALDPGIRMALIGFIRKKKLTTRNYSATIGMG
jgi:hypothetical protein